MIMVYGLWVMGYGLWFMGYGLWLYVLLRHFNEGELL